MSAYNYFRIAISVILFLTISSIVLKGITLSKYFDNFYSEEDYKVTYKYFYKTNDAETVIKSFLPISDDRQRITNEKFEGSEGLVFEKKREDENLRGIWTSEDKGSYEKVNYEFTFEGKTKKIHLSENFSIPSPKHKDYLKASEHIQVNVPLIDSVAQSISVSALSDREKIENIFSFVSSVPAAPIITLTDAVTVLQQNYASCNGKSRLFVALARNLGYPARIKGGLILEETNKRTSHVWAEVNINDQWVPFDALNMHFAFLPANYLELYEGDKFLITYTSNIKFDYSYEIEKFTSIPFLKADADKFSALIPFSLLSLVENKMLSESALMLLLMLPIGGLVVAFLRNVIGLHTFGVFLPVLIAFSLLETGYVTGMLLFIFLILFVGALSKPLNKIGLLHTPKLVVLLSLLILVMLIGSYLGMKEDIIWLSSLTFFPTIILTISAERFSTLIVEDGYQKATSSLFQTLIAVTCCYMILSSEWIMSLTILFPEFILLIISLAMLLGRYTGFRLVELVRFNSILTVKTI